MKFKKLLLIIVITLMLVVMFGWTTYAQEEEEKGCTTVLVGKKASVDGSTITSHNCDGWYDGGLVVIPAADHQPGEMAPVYFDKLHQDRQEVKKIGEIPQVPHTYKYFWVGYPIGNEHQVLMGEHTMGQHPNAAPGPDAIMWIEQLQIFALERAKTAREAIKVMGELAEKYGYGDGGECLTIVDPNEAWSFEIYAVGPIWSPSSGKPGAIWFAQRVPDDEVFVSCNISRIDQVDPSDTENFMVSTDYLQVATELGLYDPASGKPFSVRYDYYDIWHKLNKTDNSGVRLWRAYSILKPSGNWTMQQARDYPYSIKPDKLVSTEDVYRILGDVNAGNAFDNTEDPNWYVKTKDGSFKKSPLATPNVIGEMRDLMKVRNFRPIGGISNSYHFVGQARGWLPNEIGGMFWFGYDNAHNSLVVPVWTGVNDTAPSWKVADRTKLNRDSAWWAFGLVDDEVNVMYGILKPILDEVRNPLQQELFDQQKTIEEEALKLYKSDPELAKKYLTDYTISSMERAEKAYWGVLDKLYFAANNNQSAHGSTYLYPNIP